MGCCDKNKNRLIRAATKAKHIVQGNVRAIRRVKCEFTDDRIRTCWECEQIYWLGRSAWCKICKCYLPAKARVKEEKCPLGKWADRKDE